MSRNIMGRACGRLHLFLCMVAALCGLAAPAALAQSNALLSPVPEADVASANAAQIDRIDAIGAMAISGDLSVVTVNAGVLNGAQISIGLPDGATLVLDRDRVQSNSQGGSSWFGSQGADNAILVVRGGEVTGNVNSGTRQFQIRPVGGGLHVMVEIDHGGYPPEHPTRIPVAPLVKGENDPVDLRKPSVAPAAGEVRYDILVGYTPAAKAAAGDIDALIQLAIDETNQGYLTSNAGVEIRLVGTRQVNYTEAAVDAFDVALGDLQAGTLPVMQQVHADRNAKGADVVALLIDDSAYCGLGYLNSSADYAFSVTAWNCATGYYSFSHEIGHNFGAHHDHVTTNPAASPYPYGHGYFHGSSWRTIMAYGGPCGDCTRMNFFSNPSKTYLGNATGTVSVNDNARVHRERAATVAAFRGEVGPACTHALTVTPPYGFNASGNAGGPFVPASKNFTVTNTGTCASTDWSASKSVSWLNLNQDSGTLAQGASISVVVQINSQANAFGHGIRWGQVTFRNDSASADVGARNVKLTVTEPQNFVGQACISFVSPLCESQGVEIGQCRSAIYNPPVPGVSTSTRLALYGMDDAQLFTYPGSLVGTEMRTVARKRISSGTANTQVPMRLTKQFPADPTVGHFMITEAVISAYEPGCTVVMRFSGSKRGDMPNSADADILESRNFGNLGATFLSE